MFKLVWFKVSRKFVKTCCQEPETINKPNFLFEFLFIIINIFWETDVFLFSIWNTVNITFSHRVYIFNKQMSIITREIMKFHRHKFRFPEKSVTFLMSSAAVFPSKWQWSRTFLSFSVKSFWQIQHCVALSKSILSSSVIIIGLTSEDQTFSI